MDKSTVIHKKNRGGLSLCLCVIMIFAQLTLTADAVSVPTLLVLGDSIATGYGLPDYNKNATPKSSQSWSSLLADRLSYTQQNLAVDGATTSDLANAVSTSAYSLAVKNADIICISIGGNDFLQMMNEYFNDGSNVNLTSVLRFISEIDNKANSVIASALANVENTFKTINLTGTKAKVLVQTLYNPYEFWDFSIPLVGSIDNKFQPYIEQYNSELNKLVQKYGFILSDVFTEFNINQKSTSLYAYCSSIEALSTGNYSVDPHPTAEGHQRIYEVNYTALSENDALYNYLGYVTPESVWAEYGTDKDAFDLPDTVPINTNRGQLTLPISGWDTSGYDTETYKAQQFTATAKINLPDYVSNKIGISETAAVTVNVKAAPNIKEIIAPESIRGIKSGTEISEINLPKTVSIIAGDDGKIYSAEVNWDTTAYDPSRSGSYKITLTGTVTLPHGVVNEQNIPLVTTITLSVTAGNASKILFISAAILLALAFSITATAVILKSYKKKKCRPA